MKLWKPQYHNESKNTEETLLVFFNFEEYLYAGPEQYRGHGSTAPRKGPSYQEGRPNLEEKSHYLG